MTIQLPVRALEGLSRLVEQLRYLAEAADGGGGAASPQPLERGENFSFQTQRFREMNRGPEPPEVVFAPVSGIEAAGSVRASADGAAEDPQGVWRGGRDVSENPVGIPETERGGAEPERSTPEPASAQTGRERQELETVRKSVEMQGLEAPAVQPETASRILEARAVREEPSTLPPEAQPVQMEPVSRIPGAETLWPEPLRENFAAMAVPVEIREAPETPQSAGHPMTPAPGAAPSRWSSAAVEFAAAGPAPLTAEAVSQAFQRDGRRYDNGFPLY